MSSTGHWRPEPARVKPSPVWARRRPLENQERETARGRRLRLPRLFPVQRRARLQACWALQASGQHRLSAPPSGPRIDRLQLGAAGGAAGRPRIRRPVLTAPRTKQAGVRPRRRRQGRARTSARLAGSGTVMLDSESLSDSGLGRAHAGGTGAALGPAPERRHAWPEGSAGAGSGHVGSASGSGDSDAGRLGGRLQ